MHTGGIGDFLLACPSIRGVSGRGPVEILGHKARAALAVAGGIADVAHDLDSVDFDSIFSEPSPRLREFFSRFDRAVVWMRDNDGAIAGALRRCGVEDAEVHPGLPPANWDRHASEYYLDCLGLPHAPPLRLDIAPAPEAHDVVIHPGSGSPTKNWPLENFLRVAAALESDDRRVTWCVGPAEVECGAFEGLRDRAVLTSDSLVDLAAQLARTKRYIGNDGGITHLAAAVGCATLAIFGPTDAKVWAPRGEHVRVVRGTPWPEAALVLDTL